MGTHFRHVAPKIVKIAAFLTTSSIVWSQSWLHPHHAMIFRGFWHWLCVQALMPYCGPQFNPAVSIGLTICSSSITYKYAMLRRHAREFSWPAVVGCAFAVFVYSVSTFSFPISPGAEHVLTVPQLYNFDPTGVLEGEFMHTFVIVLAHLALIMRVNGRGIELAAAFIAGFYAFGLKPGAGTILNPATTLALGVSGVIQACVAPKSGASSWAGSLVGPADTVGYCAEAPTVILKTMTYLIVQFCAACCAVALFLLLERSAVAMQRARQARVFGKSFGRRAFCKIKLLKLNLFM